MERQWPMHFKYHIVEKTKTRKCKIGLLFSYQIFFVINLSQRGSRDLSDYKYWKTSSYYTYFVKLYLTVEKSEKNILVVFPIYGQSYSVSLPEELVGLATFHFTNTPNSVDTNIIIYTVDFDRKNWFFEGVTQCNKAFLSNWKVVSIPNG